MTMSIRASQSVRDRAVTMSRCGTPRNFHDPAWPRSGQLTMSLALGWARVHLQKRIA